MSVVVGRLPAPITIEYAPAGKAHIDSLYEKDVLERGRKAFEEEESNSRRAEAAARARAERGTTSKGVSGVAGPNYYEILGLDEGTWMDATEDDIRKAYKKMLVVLHPDKVKGTEDAAKTGEDNEQFILLTKAHDTLSDPQRRREYDSTLGEFDDSIPSEKQCERIVAGQEDFFAVFGPVFARNSRWSKIRKPPQLGDAGTPWEQVEAFYAFWLRFDSWREFPQHDEHDTSTAGSREEKRWMEGQNRRARNKAKAEESERLLRLAERAEAADPRVRARLDIEKASRAQAKAEREARRLEREAERRRAAEEERAAREAEERRKADEASRSKAEKEAAVRRKKAARATFRQLAGTAVTEDRLELVLEMLSVEALEALNAAVAASENAAAVLEEAYQGALREKLQSEERERELEREREREMEREREREQEREREAALKSEEANKWAPVELALLMEGFKKFPGGTINRWALIAAHVRTRTEAECIAKAKDIQKNKGGGDEAKLTQLIKSKVATPEVLQAAVAGGSGGAPAPSAPGPAAPAAAPGPAAPASEPMKPFTQDEQSKLEAALKLFPASMPKSERFEAIAAHVGRSKKDVIERIKQVMAAIKK